MQRTSFVPSGRPSQASLYERTSRTRREFVDVTTLTYAERAVRGLHRGQSDRVPGAPLEPFSLPTRSPQSAALAAPTVSMTRPRSSEPPVFQDLPPLTQLARPLPVIPRPSGDNTVGAVALRRYAAELTEYARVMDAEGFDTSASRCSEAADKMYRNSMVAPAPYALVHATAMRLAHDLALDGEELPAYVEPS